MAVQSIPLFTEAALKKSAAAVGFEVGNCFTTAVGAGLILSESLAIVRRASGFKLAAPLLSAWANVAWRANRRCGEQISATSKRSKVSTEEAVAHGG